MEQPSNSSAPVASATPAGRRKLRILYADDLHELRDVAQISFTREGHNIECFADGALALAKIEEDSAFDLVITDHHMPNMNGLEFVTQLRERSFPGKIMVFSSELSESVMREYRERTVDRILYKPVIPSALRRILGELFP
jgi:two-component system, chemotaxis family, chemotaxis protein CheY